MFFVPPFPRKHRGHGRSHRRALAAKPDQLALPEPPSMTDPRLDDLRRNIPGLRLETDPAELEHYGRDWTRRWTPAPLAIALPADVEQVQAIVRWAGANSVAIVPSGGRHGLSGGGSEEHQSEHQSPTRIS